MPVQFFRRNLPHWQPGAVPYFVTYRLAGYIPRSVLDELKRERQRRLQSPIPANLSQTEHRQRVNKIMFAQWDKYMDKSLGHCWLKQPAIAKLVQTSLYFFAGERLRLWVYFFPLISFDTTPYAPTTPCPPLLRGTFLS
jgi:putative DNA methylase